MPRAITILVVISVTLNLALSAGYVFLTFRIHQSQLTACAIGNTSRRGQIQLWEHLIDTSKPPPHETAAEHAARVRQLAAFRVYIAHQFRPVNCAKLYHSL